jgi:hypothetical protein
VRATLFQFTQNVSQNIIGPDHMNTSSKDLDKTLDGNLVRWINENEILDKQQSNNVVLCGVVWRASDNPVYDTSYQLPPMNPQHAYPGDFINRNPTKSSLENLGYCFKVQLVVNIDHESSF